MEKFNKMATAAPAKEITPGSFEAVASNHELDRVGDRVLGWDLKEIQRNPVLLWGHDPTAPIGKIDSLRVETGELLVRFTLTEGVSQADEALKLLQAGAVRALSIGFTSVGEATPNDEGGIDFEKVSIHEISLVGVPAVPAALAAAFDPEDPRSPKVKAHEVKRFVRKQYWEAALVGIFYETGILDNKELGRRMTKDKKFRLQIQAIRDSVYLRADEVTTAIMPEIFG